MRGRCDQQVPLSLHGEYEENVTLAKPNRAAITHCVRLWVVLPAEVAGTAASPHPPVRKMLENVSITHRGVHSFASSVFARGGRDEDGKLKSCCLRRL